MSHLPEPFDVPAGWFSVTKNSAKIFLIFRPVFVLLFSKNKSLPSQRQFAVPLGRGHGEFNGIQ